MEEVEVERVVQVVNHSVSLSDAKISATAKNQSVQRSSAGAQLRNILTVDCRSFSTYTVQPFI